MIVVGKPGHVATDGVVKRLNQPTLQQLRLGGVSISCSWPVSKTRGAYRVCTRSTSSSIMRVDTARISIQLPRQDQTSTQHLVAFVDEAVADSEDDERTMFVQRMARLLHKHEHHEAAKLLFQRFDPESYATEEQPFRLDADEADTSTDLPRSYGADEHGQV